MHEQVRSLRVIHPSKHLGRPFSEEKIVKKWTANRESRHRHHHRNGEMLEEHAVIPTAGNTSRKLQQQQRGALWIKSTGWTNPFG